MRTTLLIIRKETLQVLRDRIMLIQIFVPPVLQLLILAQAMTFEIKHTELALIDLDQSPASLGWLGFRDADGQDPVL